MLQLADHDYVVLAQGSGRSGRVLLRGRAATLSHFGLYDFPAMELGYERQGGVHVGKFRTSPRKVNWQSFRIEVPELYPSGKRMKGWMVSVSANFRLYHLKAVAQVIEASGVPWSGFQRSTGAKWLPKDCLIAKPSRVNA